MCPEPESTEESRVAYLHEYSRRLEDYLYEISISRMEYYHKIAEQMFKLQTESGKFSYSIDRRRLFF